MKLIIDIPELFYNNSKKRVSSGIDLPIDKYVANGMPYEERLHGEWIEKQETPTSISYYCSNCEHIGLGFENFCAWCGSDMRGN